MIGYQQHRGYPPVLKTMGICCFLSIFSTNYFFYLNFEWGDSYKTQLVSSSKSTSQTTIISDMCRCELLSIDCLDSIACIPRGTDLQDSISQGVLMRNLIRDLTTVKGISHYLAGEPIGKSMQYTAIEAYKKWINNGVLSSQNRYSIFIKSDLYSDCVEKNLKYKDCFFHAINETDYADSIESYALQESIITQEKKISVKRELKNFKDKSKHAGHELSAKSQLLMFAHICRIYFNIRSPIIQSYQKYLTTIPAEDAPEEKNSNDVLRISLHVRRADSCEHETEGDGDRYFDKASELNSTAQVTGKRFCYNTAVYMNALQKAKKLAGGPSLVVYLSTDYAGELMDQIRDQFPDLYRSSTWKYLNFPRDTFVYQNSIEIGKHDKKRPFLGETAVGDLWHLSHGQVFIGHMGSRFGKFGWLLATAKYNTFVPFFTVDGRSYCCEIDENCAEAAIHISSMEHCLTFAHEIVSRVDQIPEDNELYWKIGSTVRKRFVEMKRNEMKRNEILENESLTLR